MVQAHIFMSGFVQGVGFRQFVKREARKLNISGWVKNIPDGRVEALFQSSAKTEQEAKETIEQMVLLCKKGPFLSEVEDVVVEWEEEAEKTYSTFDIIHD